MAYQIDPRRQRMSPLAYRRIAERERDQRIEAAEMRREAEQRKFNEEIERELAARTPGQIAEHDAELARLDANAAVQRRQHEDWLDRRRAERLSPNWTGGT